MPIFEQGDTVRVPFPYTDRSTYQRRPALVVSVDEVGDGGSLLWVVMITSAQNRPWTDDIPLVPSEDETGLPAPSIIRPCKIATIEARSAEPLGRISSELMATVRRTLGRYLGLQENSISFLSLHE